MLTKKKFRFSLFDFFLYIFMIIVVLLVLLPMIHMLAVSFSSDVYVMQSKSRALAQGLHSQNLRLCVRGRPYFPFLRQHHPVHCAGHHHLSEHHGHGRLRAERQAHDRPQVLFHDDRIHDVLPGRHDPHLSGSEKLWAAGYHLGRDSARRRVHLEFYRHAQLL